jgi:hypothetical protein
MTAGLPHLYPVHTLDELNNPLGGVSVVIVGYPAAVTDACGWFHPFLPAGQYHVTFSKAGYKTEVRDWDLSENPSAPILIGLQSDSQPVTGDMIDINTVTFVNGPDFKQFKLTAKLTELKISDHCYVQFTKKDGPDRWPDNVTPGWDGPLQYSMGLVMKVNGAWYGCAPIELWHDLPGSGGPIQVQDIGDGRGQIEANWFYNSSWSPLNEHQPKPGELLGFFVVAGDPRNNYCPVTERSQIVTFKLPKPNEDKTFNY